MNTQGRAFVRFYFLFKAYFLRILYAKMEILSHNYCTHLPFPIWLFLPQCHIVANGTNKMPSFCLFGSTEWITFNMNNNQHIRLVGQLHQ
jgi:hypothetical protein